MQCMIVFGLVFGADRRFHFPNNFSFKDLNLKSVDMDYVKVQPKVFAPRTEAETAEGTFWRKLRFLEFEKQVRLNALFESMEDRFGALVEVKSVIGLALGQACMLHLRRVVIILLRMS